MAKGRKQRKVRSSGSVSVTVEDRTFTGTYDVDSDPPFVTVTFRRRNKADPAR